jgi:phage terminase large subunit
MFGMDDEEKIKSLADYDWFWVEEANELTYDDFVQLDLRLRGGRNHKIICTFNPVSAQSRLKTRIKDSPGYDHNSVWIEKTARDNKFVDEQYLKTLESLREKNPSKYKIYALNEW